MKVDPKKKHCGLAAKDMRLFLNNLFDIYDSKKTKKDILQVYKIFESRPRLSKINFIKALIEEGFIEKQKQHYTLTDKAIGFANAKLIPRINKIKAKSIVEDLVNRAMQINNDPYFVGRVTSIKLFGSYTDPTKKDCGDIDVIVDIERKKNISHEEAMEISYRRTEDKIMNLVDRIGYAEYIEPMKYLKNKNRYISFCSDDASKHKCETIYEYKEN
jgi:predicted nucleotidyltransferase